MKIFFDTSAFYALTSSSDDFHNEAKKIYRRIIDEELYTSSYVLVETIALIQKRLGFDVLKSFLKVIEEFFTIIWVDENLHNEGLRVLMRKRKKELSLVDCVSFSILRSQKMKVFAFDEDFKKEGFQLVL